MIAAFGCPKRIVSHLLRSSKHLLVEVVRNMHDWPLGTCVDAQLLSD
jgi:hypothetical protein